MDKYFAANAAFSKFSRDYMELKKSLPIRPSEMGALNILAATPGPHTCVMLAERLAVSKPMITAILTSLGEKGYITKKRSQEDKRVYYVHLTPKAQQLVADVRAETNGHLDGLINAMGQEDFDLLVELTQKASQIMEENRGGPYNGSKR